MRRWLVTGDRNDATIHHHAVSVDLDDLNYRTLIRRVYLIH